MTWYEWLAVATGATKETMARSCSTRMEWPSLCIGSIPYE